MSDILDLMYGVISIAIILLVIYRLHLFERNAASNDGEQLENRRSPNLIQFVPRKATSEGAQEPVSNQNLGGQGLDDFSLKTFAAKIHARWIAVAERFNSRA